MEKETEKSLKWASTWMKNVTQNVALQRETSV